MRANREDRWDGLVVWTLAVAVTVAVALIFAGCASSVPPPLRITHTNIADLIPPPAKHVNMVTLIDYPDIAIPNPPAPPAPDRRCKGLPGGILVSDKTYVENLKVYSQRDRLVLETRTLYKLISQERLFQDSLAAKVNVANAKLATEYKMRPYWLLSGMAAVILTAGATWRITK